MKRSPKILALFLVFTPLCAKSQDKPNILWITSEDNASHWLGCYGNELASTPRLDALAAGGLKFTRAYSNAAVCAVARSTILNGAYAVTQGTQHMRSRYKIPAFYKPHASYLRDQGYYCTNNSKTDYNFKGNDAAIWDECSGKAHYKNRPDGKPFFAIFNLTISHESNLFPAVIEKNRRQGVIPQSPRLDPSKVVIPPCQPDLPEFRSDTAIYHDCISAMDRQVGNLLDELKQNNLADNTIVFYYADHGGAMARGKRYLEDTGVRVPMIVHFPEKWRHLSPFKPGTPVDEMVAFVDLAPTLLSLCGIETPKQMQGRAFLGKHRAAPPSDPLVFLFGDRFDDTEGMRRGISDGRYKYIRCFSPDLPGAPYSTYALGQASWQAWQKAAKDGTISGYHRELWQAPRPVEMLFDTASDPWEVKNLASSPEHAERLTAMRARLKKMMIGTRDSGVIPEKMWPELNKAAPIHHFIAGASFNHPETVELAFQATSPEYSPGLTEALSSPSAVHRYWAAMACAFHGKQSQAAEPKLKSLLDDSSEPVRAAATKALAAINH